jgi:hypothetical protein
MIINIGEMFCKALTAIKAAQNTMITDPASKSPFDTKDPPYQNPWTNIASTTNRTIPCCTPLIWASRIYAVLAKLRIVSNRAISWDCALNILTVVMAVTARMRWLAAWER